jgi:hypothetical protein
MLHAWKEFEMDEARQRLVLDRGEAGVVVEYAAPEKLKMRQWTGYDPEPDAEYLSSVNRAPIPPQWHVEASSAGPTAGAFTVAVLRTFQQGRIPQSGIRAERDASSLRIEAGNIEVRFQKGRVNIRKNGRDWTLALPD